jgi:hypothetical protein
MVANAEYRGGGQGKAGSALGGGAVGGGSAVVTAGLVSDDGGFAFGPVSGGRGERPPADGVGSSGVGRGGAGGTVVVDDVGATVVGAGDPTVGPNSDGVLASQRNPRTAAASSSTRTMMTILTVPRTATC